jgi:hypothetical protein
MNVIFRPLAVEYVVEAAAWYEGRAPGLGGELIDERLAATDRGRQNPELFRIVHHHGKIRRVLTNRFPYRIFFSVVMTRFTFMRFFMARDTIAAGLSVCSLSYAGIAGVWTE